MLSLIKNFIEKKIWIFKNRRSLNNWYKRNFTSPSPTFIKLKILFNYNIQNALWIETGTFYVETTAYLSKIAKKVISIEADPRLYSLAKIKFSRSTNVEIINSKSQLILNQILAKENSNQNICIYLDAHLCYDHINNSPTFGEEENSTCISEELKILNLYIKKFNNIKIFIDDIRLFESSFHNYPSLNLLVDFCKSNNLKWTIEHDIFIASKI